MSGSEDAPDVLALVGLDSRADLEDASDFGHFPGSRADVIMLALRDGENVSLLSIPRDLYVEDVCGGGRHRVDATYERCGDRGKLSNLVLELGKITGLDIQHAVAVDLAGFQDVVDNLGGYEICTDYPLRDRKSGLEIDRGCTQADGRVTLQWLRSRHTERLRAGHWEPVPGVSDLTRNERQRTFIVDFLHRQAASSPLEVLNALREVAPDLVVDDGLELSDAAVWIWEFRDADVETAEIPVRGVTTTSGAQVLVPTVDLKEFVSDLAG